MKTLRYFFTAAFACIRMHLLIASRHRVLIAMLGVVVLSLEAQAAPDYTVATTGNVIVVTDLSGNGDTLAVSEPSAGNIQFAAAGRSFSVNGGLQIVGNSGAVTLTSVTSITVNAAGGTDSINVGGFTGVLPSLTLNGGTGDDTVNLNGDITFAANANLDVDMQNDDAIPGTDIVSVAANANLITSGAGAITVKVSRSIALAAGSSFASENGGVIFDAHAVGTLAGNFHGISLTGASISTSGTGDIQLTGKGGLGASTSQSGVRIQGNSVVSAAGSGAITITGTGGAGTNFVEGVGIQAASISVVGGDLQIIGTGGAGSGSYDSGVRFGPSTQVTSTGSGNISIVGTAGTGTTEHYGLSLGGAGGALVTSSGSGAITLQGSAATATTSAGVQLGTFGASAITSSSGSGAVNLVGDDVRIDATNATIDAGANQATVRQLSTGSLINLGAADSAGTLGLTDAELDRITAGTLNIGDANSGAITISSAISPAAYKLLDIHQGVTFSATGGFDSEVTSASVYKQIKANGAVSINAASTLTVAAVGGFVPTASDTFTLVDNASASSTTGTFIGKPEGTLVAVGGVNKTLTYVGGTGNDVVLKVDLAPTITSNVSPASGSTAGGTSVTMTGTNFTGATGVTFGGAAATSVTVVNSTTITAVTPAGTAGTASVIVTTPAGSNAANTLFTYVVPAPEIAVFDGVVTDPQLTDSTGTQDFGSVNTGSSSSAQTFTIRNDGTADLTGIAVTKAVTGNPGDFTVNTAGMLTTLVPNATTSFTVTFSPTLGGVKTSVVQIASNDTDENPFRINVGGTGVAPVSVHPLNDSDPRLADFTSGEISDSVRGWRFRANANVTVHELGSDNPLPSGQPFTLILWSVSGQTQLASVAATSSGSDGWQWVSLSSPVALTAGSEYVVALHSVAGNYYFKSGLPAVWTPTGVIEYLDMRYANGATPGTYPASGFNGMQYGVCDIGYYLGSAPVTPEAPTDIALSAATIAENNAANATVGTLSTTDVNAGDTFTYTLVSGTGSTDNGSFTLSGSSLKLTPSANYETKSSYAVRLRTTDAGGLFYEEVFTISISDLAESPSSISASGGSGTAITSPQLTARMVFSNTGSTANLAEADLLLAGSNVLSQFTGPIAKVDFADSGTNGRFDGVLPFPGEASIVEINSFALQVTGSIYVPTSGQWTFGVRSDDGSRIRIDGVTQLEDDSQHGEEERYVTVTLTAGMHSLDFLFFENGGGAQVELFSAPGAHSSFNGNFTLITSAPISIFEDVPANSLVTTFTAQDDDAGSTATFALVSGTGDDDNASFTLSSGGALTINNSPDYEVKNLYSIRVRATDGTGLAVDTVFQIHIKRNRAPSDIALSSTSISENNAANATVGTLSTTDVDAGDTFTYTLVSGTGSTDNGSFTISGSSLNLTPIANYETQSSYAVRVRTTDVGGLFYEEAFTISISKNEIVVHDGSHSLAAELSDGQATVIDFGSTSPNMASVRSFLVRNTGDADLTLSSITVPSGYRTNAAPTTLAPNASYGFQVSLEASTAATYSGNVVINSNDLNEAVFDFPVTGTVVASGSSPIINVGGNIAVHGTSGSNVLGGPVGSKLYSFVGSPAMNSSGVLAFAAKILHNNRSQRAGMLVGQPPVLVFSENQAAPSLPGVTHYNFNPPVINEAGRIAFIGEVRGAGVTKNVNSRCLFSNAGDGTLKLVVRTGTDVGLGSNLKTLGNFSIGGDLVIFVGTLVDNRSVLFGWDANTGLRPLMLPGQTLTVNRAPKTVRSFSILEASNASSGHGKELSVAPTGESVVTFSVVFTDGTSGVVVGSFDGSSDSGFGLAYAASQQFVDTYAAPGVLPLAKWNTFRSPGFDNTGTYYGFISQMVTNKPVGVSSTNDVGVFVDTAPGVLTLQLRENAAAPGTAAGVVFSDFTDLVLGGGDYEFLVKAAVRGTGVTANVNSGGLWALHATNGLQLVAREGSEAPDVAGSTLSKINQIALPGVAQPIFQATMKVGVGGVTTANDTGLWVVNKSGAVKLAVREGDTLNVGGTPRTVTAITALASDGAIGRRVFLADGQLTLLLTFTGGVQAHAKIVVP